MEEVLFGRTAGYFFLAAGIIGTLAGIDLILGAKIIFVCRRILDRGTDIIDKALTDASSRKILGVVILILSLIILFLLSRTGI